MDKILPLALLVIFVFTPNITFAHQPRIVESQQTTVLQPEVSKAYYSELTGEPDVYVIEATQAFDLFVSVLVPDIDGQKNDVSTTIQKDGEQIAILDGATFEWKKIFEPFIHDTYWQGPEYKQRAEAGTYKIRVWSSDNDSKYALAIGELEKFDGKETLNALTLIPQIKKDFFNKSPIDFILSPIGFGLIVFMYLLAFAFGFIYRAILKKLAKDSPRGVAKNIGTHDRLLRATIGVGLLVLAITTTWSPILIFFSGFCIFEAIFSWCGFYAALGRSTCEVK